jgi:hypothetical protein
LVGLPFFTRDHVSMTGSSTRSYGSATASTIRALGPVELLDLTSSSAVQNRIHSTRVVDPNHGLDAGLVKSTLGDFGIWSRAESL